MGFMYAVMFGGVAGLAAAGVFIVAKHIIERNQLPMHANGPLSNNRKIKGSGSSEHYFYDNNWEDNCDLSDNDNNSNQKENEEESDDDAKIQQSSSSGALLRRNSLRSRGRLNRRGEDNFRRYNTNTSWKEGVRSPVISSDEITTPGFTTSDGSDFEDDNIKLADYKPQTPRPNFNH